MNELDTRDPFDNLLTDALATDARNAPHLPDEWVGPTTATIVPIDQRRRSPLLPIVGGVAAASLLVGGLALLTRPRDVAPAASEAAPPSTTIGWIPAGEEFPLTDLGPATEVPDPVVAGLTTRIGIPDHPDLVVYPALVYQGEATATLMRCLGSNGGSGCTAEWNPVEWSVVVTSSIDNREADFDLWLLDGLPSEVAFVSYADGDQLRWTRPVAGVAAFPDVRGSDETVIGYDDQGVEIARYGHAEQDAAQARFDPVVVPVTADISQRQFEELSALTRSAMGSCLVELGAVDAGGEVYTFATGADRPAWEQCVTEVKAVVAQAVAELDPRYFDPAAGERPENPDSPWSFETVSE